MTLPEGLSVSEEIDLIEAQVAKMKKERDDKNQKAIDENYSVQAERLNMGEFALTRVLNEDAETKTIYLLGRFRRDPTENRALLIMRKTEFEE